MFRATQRGGRDNARNKKLIACGPEVVNQVNVGGSRLLLAGHRSAKDVDCHLPRLMPSRQRDEMVEDFKWVQLTVLVLAILTSVGDTPNATHSVTPHSRHSTLKFDTVADVRH